MNWSRRRIIIVHFSAHVTKIRKWGITFELVGHASREIWHAHLHFMGIMWSTILLNAKYWVYKNALNIKLKSLTPLNLKWNKYTIYKTKSILNIHLIFTRFSHTHFSLVLSLWGMVLDAGWVDILKYV